MTIFWGFETVSKTTPYFGFGPSCPGLFVLASALPSTATAPAVQQRTGEDPDREHPEENHGGGSVDFDLRHRKREIDALAVVQADIQHDKQDNQEGDGLEDGFEAHENGGNPARKLIYRADPYVDVGIGDFQDISENGCRRNLHQGRDQRMDEIAIRVIRNRPSLTIGEGENRVSVPPA
jgi:hypothetical protein